MVAALGLGTELTAETPSVSFGFGPGGVTFNISTYPYYDGFYYPAPPPPPPHHYRHGGPRHYSPYGRYMSPKQYRKAVKKFMKEQKKYYKHRRKHHHHHDDDD